MSINEALNQLRETLQQELGLIPTIDIRFHTGNIWSNHWDQSA